MWLSINCDFQGENGYMILKRELPSLRSKSKLGHWAIYRLPSGNHWISSIILHRGLLWSTRQFPQRETLTLHTVRVTFVITLNVGVSCAHYWNSSISICYVLAEIPKVQNFCMTKNFFGISGCFMKKYEKNFFFRNFRNFRIFIFDGYLRNRLSDLKM